MDLGSSSIYGLKPPVLLDLRWSLRASFSCRFSCRFCSFCRLPNVERDRPAKVVVLWYEVANKANNFPGTPLCFRSLIISPERCGNHVTLELCSQHTAIGCGFGRCSNSRHRFWRLA